MISTVPEISISLAPPEHIPEEPHSPFAGKTWTTEVDDGFRNNLLTPPLSAASPRLASALSPLRPPESPVKGSGLERDRFEAMLKASKERSAAVGARKSADLRKEIAQKAHKSKQMERRLLFLSKVQAPPSPSATSTPKTPPDSPAIFHYSLPSPGLSSPLSLFDSPTESDDGIRTKSQAPWVEQVDFRLSEMVPKKSPGIRAAKPLPSLDQITAHLSSHGQVPTLRSQRSLGRLPAFLSQKINNTPSTTAAQRTRPSLPIGIGRLNPAGNVRSVSTPAPFSVSVLAPILPSAQNTDKPKLSITTMVASYSNAPSPIELSESNLQALNTNLNSRTRMGKDMVSTLRRRSYVMGPGHAFAGFGSVDDEDEDKKEFRRHSSPAEMIERDQRSGFQHPVLAIPGGF